MCENLTDTSLYPIRSYIRGNSIHHTNFRCVTIHGTHNALVGTLHDGPLHDMPICYFLEVILLLFDLVLLVTAGRQRLLRYIWARIFLGRRWREGYSVQEEPRAGSERMERHVQISCNRCPANWRVSDWEEHYTFIASPSGHMNFLGGTNTHISRLTGQLIVYYTESLRSTFHRRNMHRIEVSHTLAFHS